MNTTQFHTPSFGDEVFDVEKSSQNTTNNGAAAYMYQQQTTPQTKRMINLHNTSDEYHTANEESFTTNSMSFSGSPNRGQQQGMAGGTMPPTTLAARKQISPVDPNEPAKPLSAYALFFRDTVSAIKQQNPTCSFQELSKIVASMWEALDPVHKSVYNKKNEVARNEYIKQMRIYRQQQPAPAPTDGGVQTQASANMATLQQQIPQSKPAVFTMNLNQPSALPQTNQTQPQFNQNAQQPPVANNNTAAAPAIATSTATAPPGEPIQILSEDGAVQKCTRENCTKRAIINPDWEDEYCSNECVVVHCRNVFNAWVQSNLEAKQQQQPPDVQQQQQQQTQATTT